MLPCLSLLRGALSLLFSPLAYSDWIPVRQWGQSRGPVANCLCPVATSPSAMLPSLFVCCFPCLHYRDRSLSQVPGLWDRPVLFECVSHSRAALLASAELWPTAACGACRACYLPLSCSGADVIVIACVCVVETTRPCVQYPGGPGPPCFLVVDAPCPSLARDRSRVVGQARVCETHGRPCDAWRVGPGKLVVVVVTSKQPAI